MVKILRDKYDTTRPCWLLDRRKCQSTASSGHVLRRSGFFDKNSFLEMMAPLGYRAHESMRFVVSWLT